MTEMNPDAKQVLGLFYPKCIEYEVMLAMEIANNSYPVRIASPDRAQYRSSCGLLIQPDFLFKEIDLESCAGILIPGGDTYELIEGDSASNLGSILIEACERQIPIGAICAAPAILGKHGILKTKKFTHGFGNAHQEFLEPLWEGAEFTDQDIQMDGTLLTAKPHAHIEFAVAFSELLGLVDCQEKKEQLISYYKNDF